MPNYAATNVKKFLDADGLTYFSRQLNNYPDNTVLAAVIEGVQDALDEKINISSRGVANGVAELDENGIVKDSQLPHSVLYGTTSHWNSQLSFVPEEGQIVIYSDHGTIEDNGETINVPALKIGDGNAYCIDLPFVGDDVIASILARISAHEANTNIHTSLEEKTKWNNKVDVLVDGKILAFTRE